MSISSFFKRRSYVKRTADWPDRPQCLLEVRLDPAGVNGLSFGSWIDEARVLGRPTGVDASGGDRVSLDFWQHGLELDYEGDRLAYLGVLVLPEEDIPPRPKAAPAQAALICGSSTPLTGATTPEDMIRLLGRPQEDDQDKEERVLTHLHGSVRVEFEFTTAGRLKRFSLWPE